MTEIDDFWHECIEEARLQRRSGTSGKTREKDLVLSAKFKKDKRPRSKKLQKDSNLSHIRCFRCDQPRHYAKDCKKFPPQRKQAGKSKRKKLHASATVEEVVEDEQLQKRVTRSATREEKKSAILFLLSLGLSQMLNTSS